MVVVASSSEPFTPSTNGSSTIDACELFELVRLARSLNPRRRTLLLGIARDLVAPLPHQKQAVRFDAFDQRVRS